MAIGNEFLGHYEQGNVGSRTGHQDQSPDSYIGIWYMQMGLELLARGRYAEAIEKGLKAVDSGYRTVLSYTALAAVLRGKGQSAGGEGRAGREAMKLESQTLLSLVSRAQLCLGRRGRLVSVKP